MTLWTMKKHSFYLGQPRNYTLVFLGFPMQHAQILEKGQKPKILHIEHILKQGLATKLNGQQGCVIRFRILPLLSYKFLGSLLMYICNIASQHFFQLKISLTYFGRYWLEILLR